MVVYGIECVYIGSTAMSSSEENWSAFFNAHSTPLVSLGTGTLTGRNGRGIVVYFVATFDQHPASYGVWENGRLKPGQAGVQAGGSTAAAYYGENSCCSNVICMYVYCLVSALKACVM